VIDPVWDLYARARRLIGGVSTLLEWDASIPPFPVVHAEVQKARQFFGNAPRLNVVAPSRSTTTRRSANAVSNPVAFIVSGSE
jgi:hypothetical protein